jgi:hypothetical protein
MKSDRAAWEVIHDLPAQPRSAVREWLARGHSPRDALLEANALGNGPLVTPRDKRREELRKNDRREAAEHEAAHAVTARALGLEVKSAKIAEDNSGSCIHVQGTKLESAIVLMSAELWIDRFRRDQFPYGPTGLKADHRELAAISDVFILRRAMDHGMAILRQNRALVLATSDQILKWGFVLDPWQ